MQRSYSVFYSPVDGEFAKRYPALAHLPCILDGRPSYHRLGNQYLMERGLGLWRPAGPFRGAIPTEKTMGNYAHWLVNFLEWASVRNVDLDTCSYAVHVAGRYQAEMLEGTWSKDGQGRAASTINSRVQQACDFLTWMVEKGLREPFRVPYELRRITTGSAISAGGKSSREVRIRGGKVRSVPKALFIPENTAIRKWLVDIEEAVGSTFELLCETVLLSGMRREEAACLRLNTLPANPIDWKISNPSAPETKQLVRITIKYGAKGPTYGKDHGDKIGPERSILIPLSLAKRWHTYRNGERNLAFKRWLDGVEGKSARQMRAKESVHLFLRSQDGRRFSGKQLYDAWVSVALPALGWSPQKGRHWWSCSILLRELQKHGNIGHFSSETATALLESTALSIIRLQIQPQLGHANDSTSMIYLKWAVDQISLPASLYDDIDVD